eukprot:2188961-Rhodomonas_salina.1
MGLPRTSQTAGPRRAGVAPHTCVSTMHRSARHTLSGPDIARGHACQDRRLCRQKVELTAYASSTQRCIR